MNTKRYYCWFLTQEAKVRISGHYTVQIRGKRGKYYMNDMWQSLDCVLRDELIPYVVERI